MKRFVALVAAAALVLSARPARAEDDLDRARALITEGQDLLTNGDVVSACEKFRASNAVVASGAAVMNLADCYERLGRYASAHDRFIEAADRALAAGLADVEAVARKRAHDLEPRVSTLKLRLGFAPPPGMAIERDGVVLPPAAWSVPAPVDPGAHKIVVTAPGYDKVAIDVDVARERSAPEVLVPALVRLPEPKRPASHEAQRWSGWALTALGAGGLGVGAVFGSIALADHATVSSTCPNNVCPSVSAMARVAGASDESRTFGDVSTLLFVVGAVLAGAGVVLVLTTPRASRITVGVGGVQGAF